VGSRAGLYSVDKRRNSAASGNLNSPTCSLVTTLTTLITLFPHPVFCTKSVHLCVSVGGRNADYLL